MKRALFTIGLSLIGLIGANAQSVSTWAGTGSATNFSSLDGTAKSSANILGPFGIAKDSKGHIWISTYDQTTGGLIIAIDSATGKYYLKEGSTAPQHGGFYDATGAGSELGGPRGIAIDKNDTIFFCDYWNNAIRRIDPAKSSIASPQKLTTVAGGGGNLNSTTGKAGYHDGQGTSSGGALFGGPVDIAVSPIAPYDLIITDYGSYTIRGMHRNGVVYHIAGEPNGSGNPSQDGLPTDTSNGAKFFSPFRVYVQPNGDIYVTELNQKVRVIPYNSSTKKYDIKTKTIDVSAKTNPATLNFGSTGNFTKVTGTYAGYYFADEGNVFSNDLSGTGTTKLIAGSNVIDVDTGSLKSGARNGPGSVALFNEMNSVLYYGSNIILVTDQDNNEIRAIDLAGKYTGIEDQTPVAKGEGFKVYPNPASDMVTIENFDIPTGTTTNITVYDMTGKVMYGAINDFMGRFHVELNGFPKGVYILKVQNDNVNFTSKIIVNH